MRVPVAFTSHTVSAGTQPSSTVIGPGTVTWTAIRPALSSAVVVHPCPVALELEAAVGDTDAGGWGVGQAALPQPAEGTFTPPQAPRSRAAGHNPRMARPLRLADINPAYRPPLLRHRQNLVAEIERVWEEFDAYVRRLDPTRLAAAVPGPGEGADEWTVRDVLVHLAAWKRNSAAIARLQADPGQAAANAFPGRLLNFKTDEFNAAVLQRWREAATPAILEEHRSAHADLLTAIADVPEARLFRRGRTVLWLTPALGHTSVHLADLRGL